MATPAVTAPAAAPTPGMTTTAASLRVGDLRRMAAATTGHAGDRRGVPATEGTVTAAKGAVTASGKPAAPWRWRGVRDRHSGECMLRCVSNRRRCPERRKVSRRLSIGLCGPELLRCRRAQRVFGPARPSPACLHRHPLMRGGRGL